MSTNSIIDGLHIQMLVHAELNKWLERLTEQQVVAIEAGSTSPDIDRLFDILYRNLSETTSTYIRDIERRVLSAKLPSKKRIDFRRLFQIKRSEVNDVLRDIVSGQRSAMINDGSEAKIFNDAMEEFNL